MEDNRRSIKNYVVGDYLQEDDVRVMLLYDLADGLYPSVDRDTLA